MSTVGEDGVPNVPRRVLPRRTLRGSGPMMNLPLSGTWFEGCIGKAKRMVNRSARVPIISQAGVGRMLRVGEILLRHQDLSFLSHESRPLYDV